MTTDTNLSPIGTSVATGQATSEKTTCKIFLLNAVTYTGDSEDYGKIKNNPALFYSEILNVFSKRYPNEIKSFKAAETYCKGQNSYMESQQETDFNEISFQTALSQARSLSISLHETFEIDIGKCEPHSSIFSIKSIKASLFFDAHAFIFLGYDISLEYDAACDIKALAKEIFKGRDLFANLGLSRVHRESSEYCLNKLHRVCRNNGLHPKKGDINLEPDSTLPALFLPKSTAELYELFQNEETRAQFESNQILTHHNHQAQFFHVGWNYTVAAGFSKETFITLLHVITACQGYFFTLLNLKRYYNHEIKRVIELSETISEDQVKKAESARLAFAHTLSSFHEYKSRLFPKYREEVNNILHRWNCNEDVQNIRELIELDLQAKQKKSTDRLQSVLFLLAFFQLLGLFSVFSEVNKLFVESRGLLNLSLFTIASITMFLLLLARGTPSKYRWGFILVCMGLGMLVFQTGR